MTAESFKRAGELLPLIESAKTNIAKWECAISFKGFGEIPTRFEINNNYSYLSAKHIPFEVARALSIVGFKKELEQLENEFNSL